MILVSAYLGHIGIRSRSHRDMTWCRGHAATRPLSGPGECRICLYSSSVQFTRKCSQIGRGSYLSILFLYLCFLNCSVFYSSNILHTCSFLVSIFDFAADSDFDAFSALTEDEDFQVNEYRRWFLPGYYVDVGLSHCYARLGSYGLWHVRVHAKARSSYYPEHLCSDNSALPR